MAKGRASWFMGKRRLNVPAKWEKWSCEKPFSIVRCQEETPHDYAHRHQECLSLLFHHLLSYFLTWSSQFVHHVSVNSFA